MSLSARRCAKSLVFMSSPSFARVRDPLHFREHPRPRARPHETRSFPLRPDQTIPRTLAFPHPAAFDQLPHLSLILFGLFPYGYFHVSNGLMTDSIVVAWRGPQY